MQGSDDVNYLDEVALVKGAVLSKQSRRDGFLRVKLQRTADATNGRCNSPVFRLYAHQWGFLRPAKLSSYARQARATMPVELRNITPQLLSKRLLFLT